METATREVWAELKDLDEFLRWLDHCGLSVRDLAARCVVKDRRTRKFKLLSPAAVGHLRSGKRRTCEPDTARAIEAALNVPPGTLFVIRHLERVA